ncbi:MAG: hypothetical protein ACTHWA_13155 [Arachnia sp.]
MSDSSEDPQAGMQEGISSLSKAHDELAGILSDLDSDLSSSLVRWEDNAHSAYIDLQRSWNASSATQQEIVQQMPQLLSDTPDGQAATKSRNAGNRG